MPKKSITFAARLQELLDQTGTRPFQLVQRSGINKQTISRYLQDRDPTFVNALKIAKALGVSLSVFDSVTVTMPSSTKGKSDG